MKGGGCMALVAWFPLDGNAQDYSVNGNNGTEMFVSYVNGKIGQAASFNGTDAFVNVPNASYLNPLKKLTLAAWVYTNETPNIEKNFIDKNGYVQYRIGLLSNGTRGVHSTIYVTNGTTTAFINGYGGTYYLPLQTWVHLTYVVDLDIKKISLYVNGSLHNSLTITSITGDLSMVPSSDNLWIGRYKNQNTYLNGFINDVRVYDHVLSQKEINDLAKAKVLHYTFNKEEISPSDSTGLKRLGLKLNGPTWSNITNLGSGSYKMDGVDDVIRATNTENLNITGPITMSAWVYLLGRRPLHDQFIDKGTHDSGASFGLMSNGSTGKLVMRLRGLSVQDSESDGIIPLNQWVHVAGTWDGSNTRLYINGILDKTTSVTGTISTNSIAVTVGSSHNRPAYTINGYINEARIYSTALSANDILDLYQTRIKLDNQGNLYANEFVEDYEVELASGMTLDSLFSKNLMTNTSVSSSNGYYGSMPNIPFVQNNYYYYANSQRITAVTYSGSVGYVGSYIDGPFQLLPAENPPFTSGGYAQRSSVTQFTQPTANRTVFFYYSNVNPSEIHVKDQYLINLTAVFGSGNEPTKAQMDLWYNRFIGNSPRITLRNLFDTNNRLFNWRSSTDNSSFSFVTYNPSEDYLIQTGKSGQTTLSNNVNLNQNINSGNVVYSRYEFFLPSSENVNYSNNRIRIFNTNLGDINFFGAPSDVWNKISGNYILTTQNTAAFYFQAIISTGTFENKSRYVKDFIQIDLTSLFGVGREPTAIQMDQWYNDFIQTKNKSTGQIRTGEISELDTVKYEFTYNPDTWQNWVVRVPAVTFSLTGASFSTNGSEIAFPWPAAKTNTTYGILYEVVSNAGMALFLGGGNSVFGDLSTGSSVGLRKNVMTTLSSFVGRNLNFNAWVSSPGTLVVKNFRLIELPANSDILNEFNSDSALILNKRYPYYSEAKYIELGNHKMKIFKDKIKIQGEIKEV
jgi:hypothetical protein